MSENTVSVDANEWVDTPVMGIALIVVGISVFSVQDIIIRLLSGGYSAFEIMFVRGLVALGPMALLVRWQGGFSTLRTRHPLLNTVRGLLMVCSYVMFYMSMTVMPIADVTAIFFVSPLIITALSVTVLGEGVGPRRWTAIFIGFVGALFIVRPGSDAMNAAAFLPLMASFTYACSIMITRRLGRSQTGASMAFYAMAVFVVASGGAGLAFGDGSLANETDPSLGFLLRGWALPSPRDMVLLGACGLIAACGFYCLSQGYRVAPASVVAPFEYVSMPLAVIWGLAIWGEVPAYSTFLGIALIVASGIYVLRRESVRGRRLSTGRGMRIRL